MDKKQLNDQAEQLRQSVKNTTTKLPPRSDIHKDKKKKTKLKIKYPIVRLLALFFVLIPIVILSYTFHYKGDIKTVTPNVSTEHYETIDFADPSEGKSDNVEENDVSEPITEEVEEELSDEKEEKPTADSVESIDDKSAQEQSDNVTNEVPNKVDEEQYTIVTHKVASNETLFSISIKYFKSRAGEEIIRKWNNLEQTKIYEGQVLEIPLKSNGKD